MIEWKVLNSLPTVENCKGRILAARVYADVKGGKCGCGGTFSKRIEHPQEKNLTMPVCADCGRAPALYVIDVDAKDENGSTIKFRIRHTKDAERLTTDYSVAYILNVIQRELKDGTFNVRHYDSAKGKDAYVFKNYVQEYLAHHERRLARNEISPKGFRDKVGLINRELLPHFGNMELFRIKDTVINKFREKYTSKLRTRDLALGELKSLLNQAQRDGMLTVAPKFEPIPRAKKRTDLISTELALATVEAMPKQIYRDFYTLLLIYPMRPGELRALKWSEVDLIKKEFTVCYHFSAEQRIEGRKSVGIDKKEGSISYPINDVAMEIFQRIRRESKVVSISNFVFLSRYNRHLAEASVWEAWNQARKKLGHNYAPYECRHSSASELYKRLNGDLIRMKEVGGWTNTSTLERYVTDRSDNRDLF